RNLRDLVDRRLLRAGAQRQRQERPEADSSSDHPIRPLDADSPNRLALTMWAPVRVLTAAGVRREACPDGGGGWRSVIKFFICRRFLRWPSPPARRTCSPSRPPISRT